MNDHLMQHVEQFSTAFQELSNAVEKAMNAPSIEAGYRLARANEVAVVEYITFIHILAAELFSPEPAPEPEPDSDTKKELVN